MIEHPDNGPLAKAAEDLLADKGCRDPRCTRIGGKCVGYHCAKCGGPCSSQGHQAKDPETGKWYFYCQESSP